MKIITSWDDGHPLDLKVAELLSKYGIKGTFFVPIKNIEGRPVISNIDLKKINRNFEVGSHTYDHRYLVGLSLEECFYQISRGKEELEQILGKEVEGFCYPGGMFDKSVKAQVMKAGFLYARGINNLRVDGSFNKFNIPTTLQFYPHVNWVIFKNFISMGAYRKRFSIFCKYLEANDWLSAVLNTMDFCAENNLNFHLWGHSWEVDENDLWKKLEVVFRHASLLKSESFSIRDYLFKN